MNRTVLMISLAAAALVAGPRSARAATIQVQPGSGTLAAALDDMRSGDTLVLAPGTYTGANPKVVGLDRIKIKGGGQAVIDAEGEDTETLEFEDCSGILLDGLTIRNSDNDGIFLTDCTNFKAKNCKFEDISDSGIEDRRTDGYKIDRCTFTRTSYGLALGYDSEATRVSVRRSRFEDNGDYGIYLYANRALIDSNEFIGGDAVGIYVVSAFSGNRIRKNRFENLGDSAIELHGSANEISANEIDACGKHGIDLQGSSGNTLKGNVITNSNDSGILVDEGSVDNLLKKNTASGSGAFDLRSAVPEEDVVLVKNNFGTIEFPLQP